MKGYARMTRPNQGIYTLLGYLLICVCLLLVAIVIGTIAYWAVIVRHLTDDSFRRWGGLAIFAVGTFGYILNRFRIHWHSRVLWATVAGLSILHVAAFSVALSLIHDWNDVWFLVVCTLEIPVLVKIVNMSLQREKEETQAK